MIILGIDPGIARTGWCALEILAPRGDVKEGRPLLRACGIGCVETEGTNLLEKRLVTLGDALRDIIRRWRPASMAIEELFFLKKSPSVFSVAEARGVLLFVAAKEGVPVHEYNPRTVKTSLVGSGAADKTQIQKMIQRILGLPSPPAPDDAADAAAVALCHYFMNVRRTGVK